jgi:hypothetical protein
MTIKAVVFDIGGVPKFATARDTAISVDEITRTIEQAAPLTVWGADA